MINNEVFQRHIHGADLNRGFRAYVIIIRAEVIYRDSVLVPYPEEYQYTLMEKSPKTLGDVSTYDSYM